MAQIYGLDFEQDPVKVSPEPEPKAPANKERLYGGRSQRPLPCTES